MKKAFTLIELLVVVLIIGILAAVALPQYNKTVYKTRFGTLKTLTHSLMQAEQVYYMANGEYTNDIASLDVTAPTDPYITCNPVPYGDNNQAVYVYCSHSQIKMQYQVNANGSRTCIINGNTDLSSVQAQVCVQETEGKETAKNFGETGKYWNYP